MSINRCMKKLWFIYTMKYYLAMRNNEIWPFVATWMEMESVMLSEISHTEKDRYHMFSLLLDPEKLNRRPWGKGRKKKRLEREGAKT